MFARMGILLLVSVDTAMTGRAGVEELAFYALAMAPQVPMLLLGIGMLMGTLVLGAQAIGAGNDERTGHMWRVSMGHALAMGLVFAVACGAGEAVLRASGQAPALAAGAGGVLVIFGYGLPAALLHAATSFFLESTGRTVPGMLVMLAANVLNIGLNWIFIYGNLGAPAMGAEGAALATTLVRWFMFASLAAYALLALDRARFGISGPVSDALGLSLALRRFGYPMGLAHALESAAFAAMTLFAGLVGTEQVAGFQVAFNLVAMVFMGAIGVAAAASIRVGNAVGRGDADGVRNAGWAAAAVAAIALGCVGALMGLFPELFAALYSADTQVLAVAVPCILVAAFAIVPDGLQGVLMGALRGAGDVWPATALYCVAFWGVMVPAGYVLGVARGGGAPALTLAVFLGTVVATALLGLRFRSVCAKMAGR
jgi:MATE family multidrug resistance protein